MSRSLRFIYRPFAALRSPLSAQLLSPGRTLAMAHLSTDAMAHASAVNGQPNTWQGAGAAEFDLRSRTALIFCILLR